MAKLLGTGISYLGKDEIWIRIDKCPHCGARGQLAHYTARKYLTLAGISLFSIGRVRIENECRICRRRGIVSYGQWSIRRDQTMELRRHPKESAEVLEFLEAVLQFSCLSELREEAQDISDRFAHNGHVLAALGNAFSHFREWEQADAFFEAAGDGFEVQCLRAIHLLRRGWPAEAEPLLELVFQDRLEAYRDTLYLLAEAYQARGQMLDSKRILERIEGTWPSVAVEPEHKWYQARNRGRKHLPTLALKHSIPAVPFFAQPVVYGTLTPLLLCYLVVTFWSAQERKLFLLNGTDAPYEVEIGGKRRTLVPGRPEVLTISEGSVDYRVFHSSVPSGSVLVRTAWPTRAFQKRTFLLNPDQLAILHTERNGYSKRPISGFDEQFQLHSGQVLYEFADIDYPFDSFPTTIMVSEGHFGHFFNDVTYLRRLDVLTGSASTLLGLLPSEKERLSYLEKALRVVPTQELITTAERDFSAEKLLDAARDHLDAVPVQTPWHILYQDLAWSSRNLEQEYRERLGRAPQDPELRYLLSRITGQSLTQGPFSPFALLDQATEAFSKGDFAAAERIAQNPAPPLRELYAYTLLAQRRYSQMLALPLEDTLRLRALLAAGQTSEASLLVRTAPGNSGFLLGLAQDYALGRPNQVKDAPGQVQFIADLYNGNLERVLPSSQQSNNWSVNLTLFLITRDKRELERAIDLLALYPPFFPEFRAAELLRHPDPKAVHLPLYFNDKRLLLAALCLIDPKHRESYAPLARKLNFEKSFPYWAIQKVLK